jgi:hypothetical protein
MERTAKWRGVFVVHGGTWEASGRSTREPRERLMRQGLQLESLRWWWIRPRDRLLSAVYRLGRTR